MSGPGLVWVASLDDEDLDALALRLRGRSQSAAAEREAGTTELLPIREAAEVVGVCEETIRRKVKTGELPDRRIGGRTRIDRSDLLELLAGEPTTRPRTPASRRRRRRASDTGAMAEAFAQLR